MAAPRSILILAPHPDDEVVGCAIASRRAAADGARLFVLYLTTGVPPRAALWPWARRGHAARVARRHAEAAAAMALLALEPAGFLDWPARSLKGHLAEALQRIDAALARHGITELWAPAYEGGHQDHDAANLLASRYRDRLPVSEFAEYQAASEKTQSQRFIRATGEECRVTLTAAERALKRRALALYRSERANLAHIRCESEMLRPLAVYDYAAPPHAGVPFWARFQWVPVRHPRIDFDKPGDVYATLAAFAAMISARERRPSVEEMPPC